MKLRNRIFTILLLFALLLSGCSGQTGSQGVFYPALSHTFLSNTLLKRTRVPGDNFYITTCFTSDAFAAKLYYNSSLYTEVKRYVKYSKKELPLEELLGKELGTVYGNRKIHWADKEEDLADCTHTGTLYQVAGYDESFRVCLYFEEPARVDAGQGATYHLYILDRTNNITLHTGKDYYTDLYHFPTDAGLDNLDTADSDVAAFVDALLDAEFIDPTDESLPEFDFSPDTTYFFSFTDSPGFTNSVAIYADGYVVDAEDYNFILKIDPALCQAMIDKLHKPEWPGTYKYVTYTYDNTRDIRTEYNYELLVTETDTDYTFDLYVTQTEVYLGTSTPIDSSVTIGPADTFSVSKEAADNTHLLSFVSQKIPDRPDLITYVELKKGLQEDIISLRYAATKEELSGQAFITLKKQ